MQSAKRPTGVAIIAILNIIGGVVMLFVGIAAVAVGSLFPSVLEQGTEMSALPAGVAGALGVGIGGIAIALGIFSFIVAYGLWTGKGWAWTLTVVLQIISIVMNAVSIVSGNPGGIISIIISGIILYYVYRPHVKAYFGKGKPAQP